MEVSPYLCPSPLSSLYGEINIWLLHRTTRKNLKAHEVLAVINANYYQVEDLVLIEASSCFCLPEEHPWMCVMNSISVLALLQCAVLLISQTFFC